MKTWSVIATFPDLPSARAEHIATGVQASSPTLAIHRAFSKRFKPFLRGRHILRATFVVRLQEKNGTHAVKGGVA